MIFYNWAAFIIFCFFIRQFFKGQNMRILFMDDNDSVRKSFSGLLSTLSYEVETAKDGLEAIEIYNRSKASGKPFDIVILDLTIPGGMGAVETVKRLIEVDPKIKAVVISGYTEDPVILNYQDYGFIAAIKKPVMVNELSSILFSAVNKKVVPA